MKKATHYGTCQICGRKQKAPNSLIAKHGYTVDYHYFNGTCRGADEKPFEHDRSLLGEQIDRLTNTVKKSTAYLNNVKEDKERVKALIHYRDPNDSWGYNTTDLWVEIKEYVDGGIIIDKAHNPINKVPNALFHRNVKTNEEGDWVIVNRGYHWKDSYINYLTRRLELLTELLDTMKARYDAWELKELDPV